MAYQMIHMEIAYRLLQRFPNMFDAAEFIVGSVAPDSVHMSKEYEVSMKIKSHLFEACGPWGDTQDYVQWLRNMEDYWKDYYVSTKTRKEKSFLAGVCVHCLTDYSNDLNIWRKLQKENMPPMELEEFRAAFYPEAQGIDQWLFQNSENKNKIMQLLSEGTSFSLQGLLNIEQIEKQRYHLLHEQYQTKQIDISNYQFLSEQKLVEFMDLTVDEIEKKLKAYLLEK